MCVKVSTDRVASRSTRRTVDKYRRERERKPRDVITNMKVRRFNDGVPPDRLGRNLILSHRLRPPFLTLVLYVNIITRRRP